MFVQQDFSGFDNSVVFERHLTLTRLRHSSMPLCHPAWITVMQSSLWRRSWQHTNCNKCWTRPHELSVTHGNTSMVWLISCTTSFIGLTSQIKSSTSWVRRCTDASTTKHLFTWWTSARQSLTLFSNSVCIRPPVTNLTCHVIGSALTAVGRFLLPDQLSVTHCPMNFVIWNVLQTISDSR